MTDHEIPYDPDIAAYYQCYRQPKAVEKVLESFRRFHPNSQVVMVGDGGMDFAELAAKYGCEYHHYERGTGSFFKNHDDMKEYFRRMLTHLKSTTAKWVMCMEDDVHVTRKIDTSGFSDALVGMNAGGRLIPRVARYIQRFHTMRCGGVSGFGGTFMDGDFHRRLDVDRACEELVHITTRIEPRQNLDCDVLRTILVYRFGGTVGPTEELYEMWYEDPERQRRASIWHKYKVFYE